MTKATRVIHPPIEIGQRFGLLTISGPVHMRPHASGKMRPWWPLTCDCGAEYVVSADKIKNGEKRSCYGCQPKPGNRKPRTQTEKENLSARSTTHGMTKTIEYSSWHAMKSRCTNPNVPHYPDYGGRGIKICDSWLNSFEEFYKDMGPRPSKNYTLDRLDGNGNYEPSNCQWRSITQQNRNRKSTIMIFHNGKKVPLADLTEGSVIPHNVIMMRVDRLGWSLEEALSVPMRKDKRRKV